MLTSNNKVLSEYEKNFKLIETDQKKYEVTEKLLEKINAIIKKIKEDKKYSLQKSILLGLNKIMHKEDFIYDVCVNVLDDVMDIDLLDKNGDVRKIYDGLKESEVRELITDIKKLLKDK